MKIRGRNGQWREQQRERVKAHVRVLVHERPD
jgi:hypothetical protein